MAQFQSGLRAQSLFEIKGHYMKVSNKIQKEDRKEKDHENRST